jgi:hypothetical protein
MSKVDTALSMEAFLSKHYLQQEMTARHTAATKALIHILSPWQYVAYVYVWTRDIPYKTDVRRTPTSTAPRERSKIDGAMNLASSMSKSG